MQNELITSAPAVLSGRSVEEITADIQVNYRNAKASIVAIGRDLAEVKQLLNHGEWLPYLQKLNISVSSAENYMRYASEVFGDDQLAALPYSAAMALIALPEPERKAVQEQDLDGKSAAEIKRLIAEVKKERQRADEAEQAAKATYREYEKANADCEALARDLHAERMKPAQVVEKEVAPADYHDLKDAVERLREQLTEAEDAAAEAEERANAAVAQAQQASIQRIDEDEESLEGPDGRPSLIDFMDFCNEFQSKVWAVPFMQDVFRGLSDRELNSFRLYVCGVKSWAERSLSAIDSVNAPLSVEGVISVDAAE